MKNRHMTNDEKLQTTNDENWQMMKMTNDKKLQMTINEMIN